MSDRKEIKKYKAKFEDWILNSIPDFDETLLDKFDMDDGYESDILNATWVGFVAGIKIGS